MKDILQLPRCEDRDRFERFRSIDWWDQDRLATVRVLLLGVGALGNEILKNLALLGVKHVFVADFDSIEYSNLSRSILFREEDFGRSKSEVAARRATEIYPGMTAQPFHGNIVYDLGLGIFRWADVILGGLDNREARVAINLAASRVGSAWIDGAIERLDGVARVFDPVNGPCYECTMSDVDWQMLEARRSCALLSREEMLGGKVPTTPTTSSVIAGIQCQEAVKLIHGIEPLTGKGFVFDGTTHQSYVVEYPRKPDCPTHEPYEPIETTPFRSGETTLGELLEHVRSDLGREAVVETNSDLLESLQCPKCRDQEPKMGSLGKITEEEARCPNCGEHRIPTMFHTIDGRESFLDRTLEEIGVPCWDILGGRAGMREKFYELAGDAAGLLGCLSSTVDART